MTNATDDRSNRSAREVFEDHLRTAKEWSFEEDIERNFSRNCVVLSKHGATRGLRSWRSYSGRRCPELSLNTPRSSWKARPPS
jgi:hypothetical protein